METKEERKAKKYAKLLEYKINLFNENPMNKTYREIRRLKVTLHKLNRNVEIAEIQKQIKLLKRRLAKARAKN